MTATASASMAKPDGALFFFGPYCLAANGTLLREMEPMSLPPKEMLILRLLVARAGDIVPPEDLRRAAWKGVHVSEDSLPRCVSSLRAHLDLDNCIQTVYKRGYRFSMPVRNNLVEQGSKRFVERRAVRTNAVPRLAIFPFATNPGVPSFLGPGIAEQTMLRLSWARPVSIEVLARSSVFALAERGKPVQTAAFELHADLALTGAIVAMPRHYRIRAEMLRVTDGVQVWIEDFLVSKDSLAQADARMAQRITARVRDTFSNPPGLSIAPSAERMNPVSETARSNAYAIYMRSCVQWNTAERHQMQDAIRGFHEAIELDGTLLPARTQLMHAYLAHSSYGYMRADKAAELARTQADFVAAQAPGTPGIYAGLGWIQFHHDRDFAAAKGSFEHSHHQGYSPFSVVYKARYALSLGQPEAAVSLLRAALEKDPQSAVLHGRLTWALHMEGDGRAAVDHARRCIAAFPRHEAALFFSAHALAAAGGGIGEGDAKLAAEAVAVAIRLIQISPTLDAGVAVLAYALARQGDRDGARTQLERMQWLSRERFVSSTMCAPAWVELGEFEEAMQLLHVANQQHCPWFFEMLADPRLKPLHDEPEFERLRGQFDCGSFASMDPSDVSVVA